MPIFEYTFTHDDGNGAGSITADNKKDAKAKITKNVRASEVDEYKIKNLKVEVTEVEE